MAYRFLLVALLPLIAGYLYLEGQDYDPSLIRFEDNADHSMRLHSFFPLEVGDYKRSEGIREFDKDNLYEYVNGHAEYFISAGFEGLSVAEYVQLAEGDNSPGAVVDIYDMGSNMNAFGIVSDESGGSAGTLSSGVTGFRSDQGVSFIRGQYYVRISAFEKDAPLDDLLRSVEDLIGPEGGVGDAFSALPDLGEVIQTRYVREAYRGLPFLNNTIEREYGRSGESLQLFMFQGDETETAGLVESFIDYFQESETEYEIGRLAGIKLYQVKDPYEGDWVLIPFRDRVFGVYGTYDEDIIRRIVMSSGNGGT